MAKKNEFKPDRPYSNWFSRMMPTRKQRKTFFKWMMYLLVLLILSVLQDVVLSNVRLAGATTDLVPCAIFLFCILEGTERGSVFALVSALLYVFSGSSPGIVSLVLITFIAILTSVFRQAYLQKGFGTAMLCVSAAMFLYEITVFLTGVAMGLTYWGRYYGFLITAALSLIAAPVLYPIGLSIGGIGGETWKE